jgi:hypothetical protein
LYLYPNWKRAREPRGRQREEEERKNGGKETEIEEGKGTATPVKTWW